MLTRRDYDRATDDRAEAADMAMEQIRAHVDRECDALAAQAVRDAHEALRAGDIGPTDDEVIDVLYDSLCAGYVDMTGDPDTEPDEVTDLILNRARNLLGQVRR